MFSAATSFKSCFSFHINESEKVLIQPLVGGFRKVPGIEEGYCVYRREGKDRCCCLGDRIYSIPCHASYFALGRMEEQDELRQDDLKKRINFILFPIVSAARN